jgi:hypothetical protein
VVGSAVQTHNMLCGADFCVLSLSFGQGCVQGCMFLVNMLHMCCAAVRAHSCLSQLPCNPDCRAFCKMQAGRAVQCCPGSRMVCSDSGWCRGLLLYWQQCDLVQHACQSCCLCTDVCAACMCGQHPAGVIGVLRRQGPPPTTASSGAAATAVATGVAVCAAGMQPSEEWQAGTMQCWSCNPTLCSLFLRVSALQHSQLRMRRRSRPDPTGRLLACCCCTCKACVGPL